VLTSATAACIEATTSWAKSMLTHYTPPLTVMSHGDYDP
jgi:hypothetical protein